ncbi:MAG: VTC domain-containing protein, partial [Oscillospiraceae bacterium]|nr:VTC domain-containing protein [Oscillospiraceae bacterium]
LKMQMRCAKMMPKTIVEYERTAFVHPIGNVRITFDRNIAASRYTDSFFCEKTQGLTPVLPAGMHVLEVKYDEFLPDFIAKQLEIGILRQTAFSKYYLGRLAVNGEFAIDR